MMPVMDGIEVCEMIRKEPKFDDVLICFLTARNEDYSQVAGLDAGADDYISKPLKPKVLISRINALLRRNGSRQRKIEDSHGLTINREKYIVTLNGEVIQLPRKEFELLALLNSKPGVVFEREQILSSVWGDGIVVGDRTIDVHVRKLREKLGAHYIQTVKGVGYKFVGNTVVLLCFFRVLSLILNHSNVLKPNIYSHFLFLILAFSLILVRSHYFCSSF